MLLCFTQTVKYDMMFLLLQISRVINRLLSVLLL
jgi:hypothetical protein